MDPRKKRKTDWEKTLKEGGSASVKAELTTVVPTSIGYIEAQEVLKEHEQKQEDIRNAPREAREIETLKIAKRAQRISILAIIIAIGAIAVRVFLAQGAELP